MFALRLGPSLLLGAVVAAALILLMHTLIEMGDAKLDNDGGTKIEDIFMPATEIEAKLADELPPQPDDVQEPPPEAVQEDIEFDAPTDALNVSSGSKFTPQIGLGGGFSQDSDYIPVYVPTPRYPPRAERSGKTGYAVVEVIITTTGGVRDPKLLEEYPANYGFGRSALKAAQKLKYNPRVIDGVAVEVPGVLYKFSFAGFSD